MGTGDTKEIEELASEASDLLSWSEVPLGDIRRVHAYSYRNWGIMITPENVEWLRAVSKIAYQGEWKETDQKMNQMIAEASERANLSDVNAMLNHTVARYVRSYVAMIAKTRQNICLVEIGSGAGGTTLETLKELDRLFQDGRVSEDSTPSSIRLVLTDPSEKRLGYTQEAITAQVDGRTMLGRRLKIKTIDRPVTEAMLELPDHHADIIFSNAAIHHESFNSHLSEILRVLKCGMPFVSGDWHEASYETPARVYWFYRMLQDPMDDELAQKVLDFTLGKGPLPRGSGARKELRDFCALFGAEPESAFEPLSDSERRAVAGGMRYWREVAKSFVGSGSRSPEFLLQAHERVSRRVEALSNAGFVFDKDSRDRYREVLKKRGDGELGAVMVPKRRIA
ncbi:MAG: class I SAM-dependent methyltransferase [Candidatus Micrarchaeota archaeon]